MNKEKKRDEKPTFDSAHNAKEVRKIVGDAIDEETGHAAKSGGFMVLRKNEKKEEEEEK